MSTLHPPAGLESWLRGERRLHEMLVYRYGGGVGGAGDGRAGEGKV